MSEYVFSGPCRGLWKSHALLKRNPDSSLSPIVYLRKPKHITGKEFSQIMESITMILKDEAK